MRQPHTIEAAKEKYKKYYTHVLREQSPEIPRYQVLLCRKTQMSVFSGSF